MSIKHAAAALLALAATAAQAQDAGAPATPPAPAAEAPAAPAPAPTPAAAPATPKTVISGKAYVDYTYRQAIDGATDRARTDLAGGNGTALDLKRFYLTVDHQFDATWAARIRTDVGNLTNGKFDVFVKHAFLEAKVAPELVLRAGAADLPWVPFVEDLYGYRYVENVLTDRVKLATSADWGLHASGKLADGLATYAVSAVNGRGYGDPTRTQAPAVEGRISVSPVKPLTIAVGANAGKLGQNVVGTKTERTATRYDALIAYVDGPVRVGATAFLAKDYAKAIVLGTAPEDKAVGASGWASYTFIPAFSLFARVDWVQPTKDTNSSLKDLYVNGGLAFKPAKAVDLALVYKHESVNSGQLSTSNGTIGSATAGKNGTYDEAGVFAQYTF